MEEIILGIKVDTSGSKVPVADLEAALKKMKEQIKTLPTDSQGFKVLQDEIRKTDAQVKNVNKSLEGITKNNISEGLAKIAGGASQAVASFSLLSQAFGASKQSAEEMQKAFNTAFGVVAGIKGLIETFQGLTTLMPLATAAMTAFNNVLKANPIGLVIGAVITLVGAITLLSTRTGELSYEQEIAAENAEFLTKSLEEQENQIKKLIGEIDTLKNSEYIYNKNRIDALDALKKQNLALKEYTDLAESIKPINELNNRTTEELLDLYSRLLSSRDNLNKSTVTSELAIKTEIRTSKERVEVIQAQIKGLEILGDQAIKNNEGVIGADKFFKLRKENQEKLIKLNYEQAVEEQNLIKLQKELNDQRLKSISPGDEQLK